MWDLKDRKRINQQPYTWIVLPEHPKSDYRGYVLEHRAAAENKLGRLLDSDEVVHHVNGDRKDNRSNNLEVMSQSEHARIHASVGIRMLILRCPGCGTRFVKRRRNSHLVIKNQVSTSCSRECAAIFGWQRRRGLSDSEVSFAINNNVIEEYMEFGRFDHSRCVG